MELPAIVTNSRLFGVLSSDDELLWPLKAMRTVVASLASTTNRSVPTYTDHTVKHMDALWGISDQIITIDESALITPTEAFLLAASFYLHDIGMAYAATTEGLNRIKASEPYKAFLASVPERERELPTSIANGVAIAVRSLHADAARELAVTQIPGTDGIFIFADKFFREAWGGNLW
jgi:hypothetical protein